MSDEFVMRLPELPTSRFDEPELPRWNSPAVFCETWLPLALAVGVSDAVRELAWEAAGLVGVLPGVLDADRAERCMVAAAWGLAWPQPRPIGIRLVRPR